MVSDLGAGTLPGLAEFFKGCGTVAQLVARACEARGADFVCLAFEGANSGAGDKSPSMNARSLRYRPLTRRQSRLLSLACERIEARTG